MSLPNSSDLSDFPGLLPWLSDEKWRKHFDDSEAVNPEHFLVDSINIIERYDDGEIQCDILLTVETRDHNGSRHQARLLLDYFYDPKVRNQTLRLRSRCNCSAHPHCDHAAAGLLTLSNIVNGNLTGRSHTRKAINPNTLSLDASAWIRQMKEAARGDFKARQAEKPYQRFLAYCIEFRPAGFSNERDGFHLTLRVGNTTNIGFRIESNTVKADPARPTKYMATEDLLICTRFHSRAHKHHAWGSSMALKGADWEDIIVPALATGRLFFGTEAEYFRAALDYKELHEGPPLPVDTAWEVLPDRSAKPILKLPSPGLKLIPTEPLRYIDPEQFQIGLLQSHLSPALLTAWANGPLVQPHDIGLLSRELAAIPSENPLPVPDEKPARTLSGLKPTPCLHITEIKVGPFLKRHIGGMLTFRYPGCPPVFPLAENAAPNNSWLDGTERLVLERDRTTEMAIASELESHGLIPLHKILPHCDLNDKNRHSVVLCSPADTAAEWLEFIDGPVFEALNQNGWILETNPKLGLTVHEVGDFFPQIETERGGEIDWFRFDVTAEFDGKRISLIPQIARAIREDWHLRHPDPEQAPESILLPCENIQDGYIRFSTRRFLEILEKVRHLFEDGCDDDGPLRVDRIGAAGLADALSIDSSETTRTLADLGRNLRDIQGLPAVLPPKSLKAELRHYQLDGFRWLQFLSAHGLHGILADDMGLGKTVQTLAHLLAEHKKSPGRPSLVISPTSVVPNWEAEAMKFAPKLKILVLHGSDRADRYDRIPKVDVVFTSYPLLVRDSDILSFQDWHVIVLDEAQFIKNPKALTARGVCRLQANQRLCLSGTPMENHLGELWSLMRFLMPGYLADEKSFNTKVRKPIERDHAEGAQLALNRRISPLILRRTKDQVATELPEKTTLIHRISLTLKQTDLYESLRASMDKRVRDAIASKGLAKSHIIVLDALLKLRQICCHPQLLDNEDARRITESAKLEFLTNELLPTLIEEGRRMLIFSQFTSMLALIEEHLKLEKIPYLILTGKTRERAKLVREFQSGTAPIFLISLKAGGTGLNLTAADTIIHYDPWWNPAVENQATDRAHRIGQTRPVFVHKLVCSDTIEERILELQNRKAALVKALLSEETTRLKIDVETISQLLSPLT